MAAAWAGAVVLAGYQHLLAKGAVPLRHISGLCGVVTSCSRSRNIRKNQARRRNSDQDQRGSTGMGDKGGDEERSDSATGDVPRDTAPVGNRRP